jgi:hypothetical protein
VDGLSKGHNPDLQGHFPWPDMSTEQRPKRIFVGEAIFKHIRKVNEDNDKV